LKNENGLKKNQDGVRFSLSLLKSIERKIRLENIPMVLISGDLANIDDLSHYEELMNDDEAHF
jgi:hypothetical protein